MGLMGTAAYGWMHDTCTFAELPRGRYREIAARSQKFDSGKGSIPWVWCWQVLRVFPYA